MLLTLEICYSLPSTGVAIAFNKASFNNGQVGCSRNSLRIDLETSIDETSKRKQEIYVCFSACNASETQKNPGHCFWWSSNWEFERVNWIPKLLGITALRLRIYNPLTVFVFDPTWGWTHFFADFQQPGLPRLPEVHKSRGVAVDF